MISLTRVAAMPDEPAWGQFRRMSRENGIHCLGALKAAAKMGAIWPQAPLLDWRRQVLRLMAGTTQRSGLLSYFESHCVIPQLAPSNHWSSRWPALLDQWGSHHAAVYPSHLVIRFCGECSRQDIGQFGFAWYRLGHQLPGVEWCSRHACALNELLTGRDLLGATAFVHIQPSPKRVSTAIIPSFVQRYLRAIDWLRASANRRRWKSIYTAIERLCGVSRGQEDGTVLARLITAAPSSWYKRHFLDARAIGHHPLRCQQYMQSPWLALAIAAHTETLTDVELLITSACAEESLAIL